MSRPQLGDLVYAAALQNGDVHPPAHLQLPHYHGPVGRVVDVLDALVSQGVDPIYTVRWSDDDGTCWLTINPASDLTVAPRRPRLQGAR